MEQDKAALLKIDQQVQNIMKRVEKCSYIEVGLSAHRSLYRVPHEEVNNYVMQLFDD